MAKSKKVEVVEFVMLRNDSDSDVVVKIGEEFKSLDPFEVVKVSPVVAEELLASVEELVVVK